MNTQKKRLSLNQAVITAFCILLMIVTGASDGARGVFLPLFSQSFSLTETSSNLIIMMSYVGNLIFLFAGGFFIDRMKKKTFLTVLLCIWITALSCYIFTENYIVLLCCMIFSMGASTMLSTSVNLITPLVFMSPAFFTNFFNFIQGIGLTGAQKIGGAAADAALSPANSAPMMLNWHIFNAVLVIGAVIVLILLLISKFPDEKKEDSGRKENRFAVVFRNPASILLVLMCGLYYISEHGIQNVLTSYGSEYLGFTVEKASMFLSLFFGGITVGRLLFAPIVQKIGVMKSMTIFLTIATVLYITGILLEAKGIWILCLSGLAFSIVWPTTVLMISGMFTPQTSGTAVGSITALATLFDIAFFAFFGKITEAAGYGFSIKILPVSMLLLYVCFIILKIRTGKKVKE